MHSCLPIKAHVRSVIDCFWADACIVCVHMECIQVDVDIITSHVLTDHYSNQKHTVLETFFVRNNT